MHNSQRVLSGREKHASRLVQSMNNLKEYELLPEGVWKSVAIIKSGGVTIDSETLDVEFVIPFDDNLETNEGEIVIYNLTDNTINNLKVKSKITVTAGYKGDTGIIFNGYITKNSTTYDGADKITTLKVSDNISEKKIYETTWSAGTSAQEILTELLNETGLPIKVKNFRRDHVYTDGVSVDDELESLIKQYSEVCGVSTFVNKGQIYCQYIKDFTDINFVVSEETGMIGSPAPYREEITAEDYKDTIDGYEIKMLLQHRISAAAGIKLKSRQVNGTYRVRSGEHVFNESECTTTIKVM